MRLTRSTLYKTGFVLSLAVTGGLAAPIAQANTVELNSPAVTAEVSPVNEATVPSEMRPALTAQTPAPAPAPAAGSIPAAAAGQAQLFESIERINVCRLSTAQLNLSSDVRRQNFVRSFPTGTRVNLTGVIAYNNAGGIQLVQISQPAVGYVEAANLTVCTATPTPTPTSRFRVVAPNGLIARETPTGPSQNDGPAANSIVTDVSPAQVQNAETRRWRRVTYTGVGGRSRVGWVAETGPNFLGQNLVPVSP